MYSRFLIQIIFQFSILLNSTTAAQSPPKSHEGEDSVMRDASSHPPSVEAESFAAPRTPPTSGAEKSRSDTNGLNSKEKMETGHGEPGSAWQNHKFQEEYSRAFSTLQDQQWSMSQLQPFKSPILRYFADFTQVNM